MNTFDSWSPSIDWTRFAQGTVSDPMWHAFLDLVRLCHCVEHWREAMSNAEKQYFEGKLRSSISIAENKNKMNVVVDLAEKTIEEMTRMAPKNEDEPDFKLCHAVVAAVKGMPHKFAQRGYRCLALDAFDAAQLTNSDPIIISKRWRENAGYSVPFP
jgi:hypothetical protein